MLSKISDLFYSFAKGWLILLIFIAFIVFVSVTLPLLQAAPGGNIEALDTQLFYTPEEAFSTVGSYGDASRFWIWAYLTWDIINPILYSLTFGLVISWLFQRSFKPGIKWRRLNLVPLGAGLFDVFENISIVVLLLAYPAQPTAIAWVGTVCTMSKMSFFVASTGLILFGIVRAAMNRFKKQRLSEPAPTVKSPGLIK